VNHCIQLTDVKGISWALNETPKLKSILKMVESLIRFDTDEDAQVDLAMPGCFKENFLKIDLSDLVTYLAITEYYDITKRELEFDFENFQELMKIGYALVLLQISARLMFEKQGFKIENFHKEITFENLTQLVETMNAGLEVGGQPIETSTKYIEGSLSYLRKMAILVHILTDRTREFKKEIKNLSNPASTCEPDVELSTLLNILGFDIQDLSNNVAFIDIIKEVQSIEAPKHQFCENLLEYFNQKCELTKEDSSSKEKDAEMQDEEEKIDPENDKNELEIKIPDDIIPTNLYLLTPDYYFTLLPLDPTLEQLTKKYYKKECSLCQKLTKRGAI